MGMRAQKGQNAQFTLSAQPSWAFQGQKRPKIPTGFHLKSQQKSVQQHSNKICTLLWRLMAAPPLFMEIQGYFGPARFLGSVLQRANVSYSLPAQYRASCRQKWVQVLQCLSLGRRDWELRQRFCSIPGHKQMNLHSTSHGFSEPICRLVRMSQGVGVFLWHSPCAHSLPHGCFPAEPVGCWAHLQSWEGSTQTQAEFLLCPKEPYLLTVTGSPSLFYKFFDLILFSASARKQDNVFHALVLRALPRKMGNIL